MQTVQEAQQHAEIGAAPKIGAIKERPRSPLSGAPLPPGRQKGVPNKVTRTIREAVERACQPGRCHPEGLAGWLVERANGTIGDRQIFAAMVAKAMPLQVQAHVDGGIRLELGWLGGRQIGTNAAQNAGAAPQALDLQRKADGTYQIVDQHPQSAGGVGGPAEASGVVVPSPQEGAGGAEGASE